MSVCVHIWAHANFLPETQTKLLGLITKHQMKKNTTKVQPDRLCSICDAVLIANDT